MIRARAALAVAIALLLSIAACSDAPAAPSDAPTAVTTVTPATTSVASAAGETPGTATAGPLTTATSTPAAPPAATGTPADTHGGTAALPRAASDVGRVTEHVEMLAGTIGSRFAGTDAERAAAEYIAGELEEAGYDVTIESFPAQFRVDDSAVRLPGGESLSAAHFVNSASADASGVLLDGGLGHPGELAGLDARGAIVLVDRGEVFFREMVRNAQAAGAAGVIVVNNEPGVLRGTLGASSSSIPAVGVAQAERDRLRAHIGEQVELHAGVEARTVESQNVVARAGGACEVLIGAHYDSVQGGPGGNDNASGTATMIELARVHRADGLCAVAFGAEEIGLFGSRAFVTEHDLRALRFVLNFDMTGKLRDPIIVGDGALSDRIDGALSLAGDFPIQPGSFPPNTGSDHISFVEAGIPAVTITSGHDPLLHTAGDDVDNVDAQSLAIMLEIGDIAIASVLEPVPAS